MPVFPRTPFSFPTTKAKAIVHQATARQHARRAALCVSLSLIALAPALACSPASAIESHFTEIANDRWIEVRGEGSVSAPDFAELRLGVTTTARTAHEAMTANANAANALVSLIKSEGVAPADLHVDDIDFAPLSRSHRPQRRNRRRSLAIPSRTTQLSATFRASARFSTRRSPPAPTLLMA